MDTRIYHLLIDRQQFDDIFSSFKRNVEPNLVKAKAYARSI